MITCIRNFQVLGRGFLDSIHVQVKGVYGLYNVSHRPIFVDQVQLSFWEETDFILVEVYLLKFEFYFLCSKENLVFSVINLFWHP